VQIYMNLPLRKSVLFLLTGWEIERAEAILYQNTNVLLPFYL